MYGSFSKSSLENVKALFDFTLCERPNGTRYGTSGKCRKGREVKPESTSKEARRRRVKTALEELPPLGDKSEYSGEGREALEALRRDYKLLRKVLLKKDSPLNSPENTARLISFRLEIRKREKALTSQTFRVDPKKYRSALRNSPRYSETPGSRSPIRKPSESELPSLAEIQERLFRRMKEAKSQEEKLKISQELLDVTSRMQDSGANNKPRSPGLARIYAEQGYNAKPELVGTVADLKLRNDIITHPDGSPLILYRGVSSSAYANQFRGVGKDSEMHYPGRGIFGKGSYAAAASPTDIKGTEDRAISTARDYAGSGRSIVNRVTAFSLRSDANVITIPPGSYEDRKAQFSRWEQRTLKEAEAKTGYRFEDVGEAAASLGIHAYVVPQNYEDYYVILNRGAIIAAMDSGLQD